MAHRGENNAGRAAPATEKACPPVALVTVRPGPVLHVWRDGVEAATVPLSRSATLELIGALCRETLRGVEA